MNSYNTLYNLVTGPLVWVAFFIFIGGSIYKLYTLYTLADKKEKFIFSYMSLKYGLRSIFHWIIPFATTNWRKKPFMTVVIFSFHLGVVLMPIFISGHVILFQKAWGIGWSALPERISDAFTIVVITACMFLFLRRLIKREVRYLTTPSDFLILAIVFAPFITGFLAFHQFENYRLWLILHILSGEIMLMAIPFSRLSHMLYGPFTRAYLGSEFGGIRHAKDW